ncbi:MAG: type II toxin-antitoxin system VapC family toxin [Candidatus Bathyarchaeota archaeon]|nr:type II toxin-antitoxin system VapC family toxin [Candidatus Bathyarchaeota archaeon]
MVDPKRYVDVNLFIYWLGDHPKFGETAYNWIKEIENSHSKLYITSSLTIYETLVIMAGLTGKNLKDKNFVTDVVSSLTNIKGLIIEPLKPDDYIKATDLMNDCQIDYEDALHLTVATRTGAQEIISNDKDFDNTPLKRIL